MEINKVMSRNLKTTKNGRNNEITIKQKVFVL